ncbi:MAG: uncharacterized membrane protein YheB (UPF0754 family) [Gammaproteobacteria bacterium]|jgi:uncharacterized membrane protein YheB (UPF0754 family)
MPQSAKWISIEELNFNDKVGSNKLNKSFVTNALAALLMLAGGFLSNEITLTIGLFALSGALTNWLAVHMLFEKVPGLYGSGVIPARFEDFKIGIRELMMLQFFTEENIDRFLSDRDGKARHFDFGSVINKIDMSPAFDSLISVIQESSFGGMLAMVGGTDALTPLKEPFIDKMKLSLNDISQSEEFDSLIREQIEQPDVLAEMRVKIQSIIEQRLEELTPQLVKEIIQKMIKEHLGWLVVWGGVFGGLIGLVAALIRTYH